MHRPQIVLLVGPKGAGKTHLGERLEREADMVFVRVEPVWLALRHELAPTDPRFDDEGQKRVLAEVERSLADGRPVVLESTGTAPWFSMFVSRLRNLGEVRLIRVEAPADLCLSRVRKRDAAGHIPVSDDRVRDINTLAGSLELDWDAAVSTGSDADPDGGVGAVSAVVDR